MTPDDLREQARQVRIFDELAVMISPDHADALADLIDAVAAHKASFDSPNADVVVRGALRHVRRTRGARPGGIHMTLTFVIVTTVYVTTGLLLLAVVVGCLWDGWRQS